MVEGPDGGGGEPSPLPGALPGVLQTLLGRARVVITPYPFGVSDADNLRIVAVNSAPGITIEIHGRQAIGGFESKPFRFVHTPNSNRTATTEDYVLGAGMVTNLSIFAAGGSPLIGQTFVIIQLVRSMGSVAYVMGTLLAGYVTSTQGVGWPGSAIQSSIEGGGYVRAIVGTQPAIGAEITETVPAGARWELLGFTAFLTTGAAVPARTPFLLFDNGAVTYAGAPNPGSQGATDLKGYLWGQQQPFDVVVSTAGSVGGLPGHITLLAGHRITTTGAVLPGDQWGAPRYLVRELLEAT